MGTGHKTPLIQITKEKNLKHYFTSKFIGT